MTPSYFREIREDEGLSAAALARLLGVNSGRTVRRWEAGDRKIPKTVEILMLLLRDHGAGFFGPHRFPLPYREVASTTATAAKEPPLP